MKYFCPKCRFVCKNKKNASIFVELHCVHCGHIWYDTPETNKPTKVREQELGTGASND